MTATTNQPSRRDLLKWFAGIPFLPLGAMTTAAALSGCNDSDNDSDDDNGNDDGNDNGNNNNDNCNAGGGWGAAVAIQAQLGWQGLRPWSRSRSKHN